MRPGAKAPETIALSHSNLLSETCLLLYGKSARHGSRPDAAHWCDKLVQRLIWREVHDGFALPCFSCSGRRLRPPCAFSHILAPNMSAGCMRPALDTPNAFVLSNHAPL